MTANGLPLSRNERVYDKSQVELTNMVVSKYCVAAIRSATGVWFRYSVVNSFLMAIHTFYLSHRPLIYPNFTSFYVRM